MALGTVWLSFQAVVPVCQSHYAVICDMLSMCVSVCGVCVNVCVCMCVCLKPLGMPSLPLLLWVLIRRLLDVLVL